MPYLDGTGVPTDPTTPDTEVSKDGGAFADCTEEVTTISGSNGEGYITLTGAETDCSLLGIAAKVASGPKNTIGWLYPRNLPIVSSGTLSAGSAGGGTLGTILAYDITGCILRTTGGTGGGGTGGANNQARVIATYTVSTGAFTVGDNWETTPDNTTTYDVLLPDGMTLGTLKALNPTTAGRTLDVSSTGEAGLDWANVGSPTTTLALTGTTIASTQKVDVDTIKTNPVVNGGTITFPTNATVASTTGAVGSVTGNVGGNVNGSIGSLATQAKADVNAEADTALADVGLTTTITGRIDAAISSRLASASYTSPPSAASIRAEIDSNSTGLAAIYGDTHTTIPATLATIAGYVDTEVAAIKAKTDNLPSSPAATGDAMTLTSGERNSIASALLGLTDGVETGITVKQALRAMAAMLAGLISGAATSTITVEAAGNSGTTRLTFTADENGNRSAVTLNL